MPDVAWSGRSAFVVVSALRTLGGVLGRLDRGARAAEWVVVQREVPWAAEPLYYVFEPSELRRVARAHPERLAWPAAEALDLHEADRSPTVPDHARAPADGGALAGTAPAARPLVALDAEGRPVRVGTARPGSARPAAPPEPAEHQFGAVDHGGLDPTEIDEQFARDDGHWEDEADDLAPPPPPPLMTPVEPPPDAAPPSRGSAGPPADGADPVSIVRPSAPHVEHAAAPPTTGGWLSRLLGGFRGGSADSPARDTPRDLATGGPRGIDVDPPARSVSRDLDTPTATEPPAPLPPGPAPTPAAAPPALAVLLSAEAPPRVAVGDDALIDVRLDLDDGRAAPLVSQRPAVIAPAEPVRAILSISGPALETTGPRVLTLPPPGPGAPSTNVFEVRGAAAGAARVEVRFRQQGSDLGALAFEVHVAAAADPGAPAPPAESPVRVTAPADPPAPGDAAPDLTVLIQEARDGGRLRYTYLVDSDLLGLNYQQFESPAFVDRGGGGASTPLAYVRTVYDAVVNRALVNRDDAGVFARELKAIGADMARQLFDDGFARLLWANRARVRAVHVTSWEPYIPWELVRLKNPDTGETDDRFLGEYGLVRSLSGPKGARRLAMRDWRYVVAAYPEQSEPPVGGEASYLTDELPRRGVHPVAVAPELEAVLDALAAAEFDVLHVASHGRADQAAIERAELVLGDRRTPRGVEPVVLSPATVREEAKLAARRPLVFLNACESGRLGPSLTDCGGWPRAFLGAGAGTFVGTSWSVRERPAQVFARTFYDALLGGRTLAEAAAEARAAAKVLGDGSWLAFVVYGEPGARAGG